MLNQSLPSSSESLPDQFLKQNPVLSVQLLADLDQDLDQVRTLLYPALNAQHRCQAAEFYIQAVTTERTAFLITNLSHSRGGLITETASNWLIGRNSTCDISIRHMSISRFHAAVGFTATDGFHITDLNSANGSWVNRRRLDPMQRMRLRDGDLIRIASYRIEFFWSGQDCLDRGNQEAETWG